MTGPLDTGYRAPGTDGPPFSLQPSAFSLRPGPLSGLRVLDMTVFQQGPVAAMLLADLGAEVIKIEEPVRGDPGRGASLMQLGNDIAGQSAYVTDNFYFESFNRNKRAIVLNVKSEAGREALLRLVKESDIFVQNQRHGVMAKLGLDEATLRAANPRLIYASGSGYGPQGPDAHRPSYDLIAQARSGLMSHIGEPDAAPIQVRGIADQFAALMLAYGICLAVLAREKTGQGQSVDASLLASTLFLQGEPLREYLAGGSLRPKTGRRDQGLDNVYRASDDWFAAALDSDWPKVAAVLGRPDLVSAPPTRALIDTLDALFATRSAGEWLTIFRTHGIAAEPVNRYDAVEADPQVHANGMLVDHFSPTRGPVKLVAAPFWLERTPPTIRSQAGEHGQHTEEVLIEIGGYDWDTIEQLRERGAY